MIPGLSGSVGHFYEVTTDYAATIVLLALIVAGIRRVVFKPVRYAVPARFGKAHNADAIFLLTLIAILMVADSLFEATKATGPTQVGFEFVSVLSITAVAIDIEECSRLHFVAHAQSCLPSTAVDAHCPTWLPGLPTTAPTTSISICRIGWLSTTKSFLARSSSLANWSCSNAGLGRSLPLHLAKRTPHHMAARSETNGNCGSKCGHKTTNHESLETFARILGGQRTRETWATFGFP